MTGTADTGDATGTPAADGAAAREAAQAIFHGVPEPECQQATPAASGSPRRTGGPGGGGAGGGAGRRDPR